MKWAILFGGGLVIFLYAMSSSAQSEADTAPDIQPPDSPDTGGQMPTTVNRDALVLALAVGIANNEGYFREGSVSRTRNNPGDIRNNGVIIAYREDSMDQPIAGGGWNALFRQLNLNLNGSSREYQLTMTIRDMMAHWINYPIESTAAQLNGAVINVISSLNGAGYPATEDTTLGALARGDFSG